MKHLRAYQLLDKAGTFNTWEEIIDDGRQITETLATAVGLGKNAETRRRLRAHLTRRALER